MRPTKTWKLLEKEVAKLFSEKGVRNALSGRNNSDDKGQPRPGDCIVPELTELGIKALIECKLYKSNAVVKRAEQTRKEAKELEIENWFHLERRNGNKNVYLLATSPEWMKRICEFIKEEMINDKYGEKNEER